MSKRPICSNCQFLLIRCLCDTLKSISNRTHLIILQHPNETKHALNTVALMKKSFQNVTLLIGEDFNDHEILNEFINVHSASLRLLFPTSKSTLLTTPTCGTQTPTTHLILIDGTWKKAQKIFIQSKNLHALESLKLETHRPSLYKIRSSKIAYSLSTLEAAIAALAILEPDLETKSLEDSFKKMIEFQIEKMGDDVYQKNYLKAPSTKKENDE